MGAATMKRKDLPLSDHLQGLFQREPELGMPGQPEWLAEEREVCRNMVLSHGLPGQGREQWKYTDVSRINQTMWTLPSETPSWDDPKTQDDGGICHLTILNGSYLALPETNIPKGIKIRSLSNPANLDCIKPVLQRTNYRLESIFSVMNRVLWHDGLCIHIAPETKATLHVNLVYSGIGRAAVLSAPRVYIKVESHSELDLTVSQWNNDHEPSLGTACLDMDLMPGAKVVYNHEQLLNTKSHQFTTTRANVARDAALFAIDVALGASLSRHDLTVSLQESGSEAHLNGIYLLRDKQLADFHTVIEHRQPHCSSRQVYKGVLDDHAHAVFNGLVEVHPGAMGTDGYQLNRTLLRSPHAVIDTKPELQIHNDDVKCSHGATVGQLDPMELFYLQSRCIPTSEAKAILSRAFVVDLIHQQPSMYQQKRLQQAVEAFFDHA